MNTSEAQSKQKRIGDLTLREIDMVYSLMRVQDWSASEISRVYKLSADDVHEVFDNYPQLREEFLRNPTRDVSPQVPESESTTTAPRKRRSDARFATTAERQAAYRARLKENRHSNLEQPSPSNETDSPRPDVQEPSVTVCEAPSPEIGRENAKTQQSAYDGSSEECHDISESVPVSVTPEACSKKKTLQEIEE